MYFGGSFSVVSSKGFICLMLGPPLFITTAFLSLEKNENYLTVSKHTLSIFLLYEL